MIFTALIVLGSYLYAGMLVICLITPARKFDQHWHYFKRASRTHRQRCLLYFGWLLKSFSLWPYLVGRWGYRYVFG